LLLPAQCTMILAPSTAASIPSPVAKVTGHELDSLRGVAAAPAEHPYVAAGVPHVVYSFTTSGEKITAIDLIADPARLRQLDLVIAHDWPQP
jgi:hypothetical protein